MEDVMVHQDSPLNETYRGHKIITRKKGKRTELLIDGVRIKFGQDAAGLYYLQPYAYDRAESLLEVVKRYLDYRAKQEKRKPEKPSKTNTEK
jgi:hypothetical protein